jgi:hypothetical protein
MTYLRRCSNHDFSKMRRTADAASLYQNFDILVSNTIEILGQRLASFVAQAIRTLFDNSILVSIKPGAKNLLSE